MSGGAALYAPGRPILRNGFREYPDAECRFIRVFRRKTSARRLPRDKRGACDPDHQQRRREKGPFHDIGACGWNVLEASCYKLAVRQLGWRRKRLRGWVKAYDSS